MTSTTDKTVRVILAFHAHEPLWDTPRRLQRGVLDHRIAGGVTGESYIRKRLKEGRNVYRDLVALAESLSAPITLDLSNELGEQLRHELPSTFGELRRAYETRLLRPVYLPAHHTHAALLDPDELLDELRLNEEFIHGLLGAPIPARRGLFFTECSIDQRFITAVEAHGIDFTFCPTLDPEKVDFTLGDPDYDYQYRPFRLGDRLIAFQRHFPVSQEVWRPLTRRFPERVKYQGFFVGEMPVFAEEYRGGDRVGPESDLAAGIEEYASVLRQALSETPDGGLILYLQDLELMDFGEPALELITAAWSKVQREGLARIQFSSAEDVLVDDDISAHHLPEASFHRASWAPEIRPALRSDGHYPPRGAGSYRGVDAGPAIFRKEPFVFWEAGRFITTTLGWLVDSFGFERTPRISARTLFDEDYRIERFPPRIRLPLLLRLSKRACNFGWYPEEGLNKRPYLDGYLICDALLLELRLPGTRPRPKGPLPPFALLGMARLPELIVDTRIGYLQFGLERMREERGVDLQAAFTELDLARAERRRAGDEVAHARDAYQALLGTHFRGAPEWTALLSRLREHLGAVFLALDHLQRTWGHADPEFLIATMYRYLYDVYPPRAPELIAEVYGAAEEEQEEKMPAATPVP
jgi:hypothetical protein